VFFNKVIHKKSEIVNNVLGGLEWVGRAFTDKPSRFWKPWRFIERCFCL